MTQTNPVEKIRLQKYVRYVDLARKKAGIDSLVKDQEYEELTLRIAQDLRMPIPMHINIWKRLYGKLSVSPSYAPEGGTLKILAKYLGCNTWEELLEEADSIERRFESPIKRKTSGFTRENNTFNPLNAVHIGDRIRVHYTTERMVEAEYLGGSKFKVTKVENCKLKVNDIFVAYNFVPGDLFRVMNVKRGTEFLGDYSSSREQYIDRPLEIIRSRKCSCM